MIVDANGYWPQADAVRVIAAVGDLDFHLEQPCATVAECAHVRSRCRVPLILDEVLTGARELGEAHAAGALDAVRLKLSNVGGITPTRRARDLSVALGLPLTVEDAGGGDIVTAASMHLGLLDGAEAPPRRLPPLGDGRGADRRGNAGRGRGHGAPAQGAGAGVDDRRSRARGARPPNRVTRAEAPSGAPTTVLG